LEDFKIALVSFAPRRFAPVRFAPVKSAPVKSARLRSAPARFALRSFALRKFALVKFAFAKEAPFRFAFLHCAFALITQPPTVFAGTLVVAPNPKIDKADIESVAIDVNI
jgi:hypothetical protein